jgi:plastocyanin
MSSYLPESQYVANGSATMTFNGSSPGPFVEIALHSLVTVHFSIAASARKNASWALIPAHGNASSAPVFPGAGSDAMNRSRGIAPGENETFHFLASETGSFWYVSEVPGELQAGMYGWFNVTSLHYHFNGRHFILIAGEQDSLTFNGTSPGPSLSVPLGSFVWVTFEVSPSAGITHSWVLIPLNGTEDSPPVFPEASSPDPHAGSPPGSSTNLSFLAERAGSYRYICEMPGHYAAGMWRNFTVVSTGEITAGNGAGGTMTLGDASPAPRSGGRWFPIELLRIGIGVIWLFNLIFIIDPVNDYFGSFAATANSFVPQTPLAPWSAAFVADHPAFFAVLIGVVTGALAGIFLTGMAVRAGAVIGALLSSALLWTQWSGTFSMPGATDVGPHPLYLLIYLVLFLAPAGVKWTFPSGLRALRARAWGALRCPEGVTTLQGFSKGP